MPVKKEMLVMKFNSTIEVLTSLSYLIENAKEPVPSEEWADRLNINYSKREKIKINQLKRIEDFILICTELGYDGCVRFEIGGRNGTVTMWAYKNDKPHESNGVIVKVEQKFPQCYTCYAYHNGDGKWKNNIKSSQQLKRLVGTKEREKK